MMTMITKEKIRNGIAKGIIRFIVEPGNIEVGIKTGTVCAIGEYWFYFGGQTAENESPDEFLKNADIEEVIDSIFAVLEDFRRDEDSFGAEYTYYEAILDENLK